MSMWLFLSPHIPAMSQNLCGIASPLTVLGIASLLGLYLAGGNQVFQLLHASYDFCSRIFAKCLPLHDTENILQHDFSRVDRSYKTSSHRLCGSGYKDTFVINVLFGFPLPTFHCFGYKSGARGGADAVVIILGDRKLNNVTDLHISKLVGYAESGYFYCLFHIRRI